MADRLMLSNDTVTAPQGQGIVNDIRRIFVPLLLNDTSIHGTAAVSLAAAAGPIDQNGRVVDFRIGVARVAVSASGFVSGTVSANLRINSVSCLSTLPGILGPVAGSATQAVRTASNLCSAGNGTSAVVNTASANFSAGDTFQIDWTANSAGSAAATATGTGLYAEISVRYASL